jgi:glycosyltransferase involved in cell wall biosynthesis
LRVTLLALNATGTAGIPRYTVRLAQGLDGVAGEFPDVQFTLLATEMGLEAIGPKHIPTRKIAVRKRSPGGVRRLALEQLAISRDSADVVHFFDVGMPLLSRKHFVVTFHDASIRYPHLAGFNILQRWYKNRLYPLSLAQATFVISVSRFAKEEAIRLFGADPRKIAVIHSGPGFSTTGPQMYGSQMGRNGRAYLLCVGNLTRNKNVPFLIRAFERADVTADLLIAGRPLDDAEVVVRAIRASPKRDQIHVIAAPSDEDLDRLYRRAAALVFPSRYEGFGFPPLEAMARGCPVLASDIPPLREVAAEGALLLPFDEAVWSEAIRRVVLESRFSADLRNRGFRAVDGYSWQATARQLCEVFRGIKTKIVSCGS